LPSVLFCSSTDNRSHHHQQQGERAKSIQIFSKIPLNKLPRQLCSPANQRNWQTAVFCQNQLSLGYRVVEPYICASRVFPSQPCEYIVIFYSYLLSFFPLSKRSQRAIRLCQKLQEITVIWKLRKRKKKTSKCDQKPVTEKPIIEKKDVKSDEKGIKCFIRNPKRKREKNIFMNKV
jgi:hypothetical protein